MNVRPPGKPLTGILVFVVLLCVMTTGLYALLRHGTARILAADPAANPGDRAKLMSALLLGVLLIGVLIIVFVMGAYLVLRAGRAITRSKLGGKETELRDAWTEVRVTPQELEAADEQLREAQGPRGPEDQANDR